MRWRGRRQQVPLVSAAVVQAKRVLHRDSEHGIYTTQASYQHLPFQHQDFENCVSRRLETKTQVSRTTSLDTVRRAQLILLRRVLFRGYIVSVFDYLTQSSQLSMAIPV